MMKKHLQPLTPAALYARVSSDRQDVDLSVSAQMRALKDYAKANGYSVAREYVDEAESGRVADRPQFREMIEEGGKPQAPFDVILVWKFSRFTRKREHAVAFKSMLRRKGIRVVSITEHADDSPTGKLMEAIIESVDEFYSENLAEDVVRGMREAASRGFFLASNAPFGYKRVKVSDGVKERPTLEVDPATAPVVREIFEKSLRGSGLKEICKELNDRGITNRGKRWYKGTLHYVLRNEAYTGTAVWGHTSKGEKTQDPVRVEGAWPALISRELFDEVQQAMRDRAPKVRRPARVGSRFLLSGLLKCGVCGRYIIAPPFTHSLGTLHLQRSKWRGGRQTPRVPPGLIASTASVPSTTSHRAVYRPANHFSARLLVPLYSAYGRTNARRNNHLRAARRAIEVAPRHK